MSTKLPLIVGFGGFNAAGRSSGFQSYSRMIWESLSDSAQQHTAQSLAAMMGMSTKELNHEQVLARTLVRKIEAEHFDVGHVPVAKKAHLPEGTRFVLAKRQLPEAIPSSWKVTPVDAHEREFYVDVTGEQEIKIDAWDSLAVTSAGQLPSGFRPADTYKSLHHPRGLQLAILGASDAVKSMGLAWQDAVSKVAPDKVGVYSASIMSQLDDNGFGGMLKARSVASRVSSKQLALGLNSMPADFINAYVLGNVGSTAAVTGACASFLYNLQLAVEDIKSGRRQICVVGASEAPILPEVIEGYAAMSALASDAELMRLDGSDTPNHRRASRPFGENCGFTIAESSQYVVLMADDLAVELGAEIYGAVPAVFVNADGFKKSISAPGAGNYITMAKAVALAKNLLGEQVVQQQSFVQAHGSSTPQNRVTESKILDQVAQAFGIEQWPVAAIKSYLGHSLAVASGDQMAATLGVFHQGVVPGIKTLDAVAEDVFAARLSLSNQDQRFEKNTLNAAFLNSKGFGGNNATGVVFSPSVALNYLHKRYGEKAMTTYSEKNAQVKTAQQGYLDEVNAGRYEPIYAFGTNLIDEEKIEVTSDKIVIPGYASAIDLTGTEGFDSFIS